LKKQRNIIEKFSPRHPLEIAADLSMPDKKRPRSALGSDTEDVGADCTLTAAVTEGHVFNQDQTADEVAEELSQKLQCSVIAQPLAGRKLTKRILKLAKKLAGKKQLRRGVKEVVKSIRKGARGFCVMAADVAPVDVIAHVPILCEETGIPYCFVPSRELLGKAAQLKRPTCVLFLPLIEDTDDEEELKLQRKCWRDLATLQKSLDDVLREH